MKIKRHILSIIAIIMLAFNCIFGTWIYIIPAAIFAIGIIIIEPIIYKTMDELKELQKKNTEKYDTKQKE